MIVSFTEPGPFPTQTIAALLRLVLAGLCALLRFVNPNHPTAKHLLPLHPYLMRTATRFERLMARYEAGTLAPARPRPNRTRKPSDKPRQRFPRAKAWILRDLGWKSGAFASHLTHLLDRPDTAGIIAATPQMQRLLRPLCHMLGITPASIPLLPQRPRTPRPAKPPKPRSLTRKQREAILWYPNSEGRPMQLLPRRLPRD